MISVQPTGPQHYLSLKQMLDSSKTAHYFYASWEDALWDLLKRYTIKKNAVVLVPSFFCIDVIENMEDHGLQHVFYPCDRYFKTSPTEFKKMLAKHTPEIVVIFHPVGMTNSLFADFEVWKNSLPATTLLIEDSVHRIVDPSEIEFKTDRHFVIDSLRKVVPLPGSNLWSSQPLPELKTKQQSAWLYRIKVLSWWVVFQVLLTLRVHGAAEHAMLRGYDVIGDSQPSGSGWPLFKTLAARLNIPKIRAAKQRQVTAYLEKLKPLQNSKKIFFFPIEASDHKLLRGFPIGLSIDSAQSVLTKIRQNGLLLRFELNDSPWSKKYKVVYLPLGPYLTDKKINQVCEIVKNAVATA